VHVWVLVFVQAQTHVYTHTHTHNSFDFLELSFPLLKSIIFTKQNFIFQIQVFNKTLWCFLPFTAYNREAIHDSRASDVMSPKLAAIGVATLSGLILKQRETTTTVAVIKPAAV